MTDQKMTGEIADARSGDQSETGILLSRTGTLDDLPDQDAVRSWTGTLSDTLFRAAQVNGQWILEIRLDTEIPVVLQSPHAAAELLEIHAQSMDFSLALARSPDRFDRAAIRAQALSALFCRDLIRAQADALEVQIAAQSARTLPTGRWEHRAEERRRLRNVSALTRIAERIDERLRHAFGDAGLALVEAGFSSTHH